MTTPSRTTPYGLPCPAGRKAHQLVRLPGILFLLAFLVAVPLMGVAATYTFTTIEVPGAVWTEARGINNAREIVGTSYNPMRGFFRAASGDFTALAVPGADTGAEGINGLGEIVGQFYDNAGAHGYLRDRAGRFTTLDVPGAGFTTQAQDINDSGQIVGFFESTNGVHGFLRDAGGSFTALDVPGVAGAGFTGTFALGINDQGWIVGGGGGQGFVRDGAGSFTTFDAPGANLTEAMDINNGGTVVGIFADAATGRFHGFLRDPGGDITTFDVPDAFETRPAGINDQGYVVGFTTDTNGLNHSFLAIPTTIPTVSITTGPPPDARLTTGLVQFGGQAGSGLEVAAVEWQLSNAGGATAWQAALGTTNWSVTLTNVAAGSNNFRVRARDTAGSLSPEASRSFVLLTPLTITVTGCGILSPNYLGTTYQEPGAQYTVTATPCAGFDFSGWTGGAVTASAALTFEMQPGLTLQANFAPRQYIPLKATYNGLFYETNGVSQGRSGAFTLSTTTKGKFTGTLQLGGSRHSISGQFNTNGHAQIRITGRNPNLTMDLQMETASGAERIVGSLGDSTWSADLAGDRAVFDSKTNAAPQAGKYTLAIRGSYSDTNSPAGYSYGTVSVDKAGKVSLSATLADGTKFSQTGVVSRQGHWPLYLPLYSGKGSLLSWITFTNTPEADLAGALVWLKPALPKTRYYPAGFTLETTTTGSRYNIPATGHGPLNLTTASLVLQLQSRDLALSTTIRLEFDAAGHVTSPVSRVFNLGFTRNSGLFAGQVASPITGKPIRFNGAVLQKQNTALGFFLSNDKSGQALLMQR